MSASTVSTTDVAAPKATRAGIAEGSAKDEHENDANTDHHRTDEGGREGVDDRVEAPADRGPAERPMRADAKRNRDALLAAAVVAFSEHGVESSLEDIAQRAGVGIGTLYRNFPTREVLIESVYRNEVEKLCDGVAELQAQLPPAEALAEWMQRFVAHVARKRGMAVALKQAALQKDDASASELFAYAHARIRVAMSALLDAGVAAGTVRADVDPMDLIRAMSGICLAIDQPGWLDQARRLVTLLMDGMRYGAAGTGSTAQA